MAYRGARAIYIHNILNNIRTVPRHISPDLCWRTFHIISNGLRTSRRFQERAQPCLLCQRRDGDELEHYARCQVVQDISRRTLPLLRHVHLNTYTFFLTEELQPDATASIIIMHDLLTWAIRTLRHGHFRATPQELFEARAHQLLRRRPALARYIRPL